MLGVGPKRPHPLRSLQETKTIEWKESRSRHELTAKAQGTGRLVQNLSTFGRLKTLLIESY